MPCTHHRPRWLPPAAAVPAPVPPANLAVGIAMGTLFGLIAAIVYAVVTILIDREFAALALLVGFAIAYGFHRFGKTRGVVPGIIAAVIALVMFFLAIFIETAGAYAKYVGVSFVDGMRAAVQNPDLVISGYFSDGLSYLFALLTVVYAFYYAKGGKSAKVERAAGGCTSSGNGNRGNARGVVAACLKCGLAARFGRRLLGGLWLRLVVSGAQLFKQRAQLRAHKVAGRGLVDRLAQRRDLARQVFGVRERAFGTLAVLLRLHAVAVCLAILREQDQWGCVGGLERQHQRERYEAPLVKVQALWPDWCSTGSTR